MTWAVFAQNIVNGISLGSLYALVAIGYTMVYGILRLINFAHSDVFMLGAYMLFYIDFMFRLPWWLTFVLAAVLTGVLGITIERVAYRPLRQAPRISSLISAIGISFFIQNLGLVVFGGRPKPFPVPQFFSQSYMVGSVYMANISWVVPVFSGLLMLGLTMLVYRTKVGLAMRAISHDMDTSSLMSVNVDGIIAITFGVGSALAAAGGIMWALKYPQINPLMGTVPGIKAFIAAVLGGTGSIPGAMIGGMLLGMLEIMLVALMPTLSGFRDAFAYLVLIVILLARPTGLLGREFREKV
ncbi:MAG: High-affinity branched-chain amino acid transport system permease protein LivH [Firmicutes bacterium ADurb.Bin506]|nr:MAG: High-affinity branched-chain amino acid transport system permease protein LivH [Firmicutes bacterium ADurb.Bin506]